MHADVAIGGNNHESPKKKSCDRNALGHSTLTDTYLPKTANLTRGAVKGDEVSRRTLENTCGAAGHNDTLGYTNVDRPATPPVDDKTNKATRKTEITNP